MSKVILDTSDGCLEEKLMVFKGHALWKAARKFSPGEGRGAKVIVLNQSESSLIVWGLEKQPLGWWVSSRRKQCDRRVKGRSHLLLKHRSLSSSLKNVSHWKI